MIGQVKTGFRGFVVPTSGHMVFLRSCIMSRNGILMFTPYSIVSFRLWCSALTASNRASMLPDLMERNMSSTYLENTLAGAVGTSGVSVLTARQRQMFETVFLISALQRPLRRTNSPPLLNMTEGASQDNSTRRRAP